MGLSTDSKRILDEQTVEIALLEIILDDVLSGVALANIIRMLA